MADDLTLDQAQTIIAGALQHGRDEGLKPLAVAVLDARGVLKAYAAQDGASLGREGIAKGKAYGGLAMGFGSRALHRMALERPHFVQALHGVLGGPVVPVPGGVLVRDARGRVVGAVGISGDTSDADEAAALAGIAAAGLAGDPGA